MQIAIQTYTVCTKEKTSPSMNHKNPGLGSL